MTRKAQSGARKQPVLRQVGGLSDLRARKGQTANTSPG